MTCRLMPSFSVPIPPSLSPSLSLCSFTDTDADPYNADRGLWYSHIGWLFEAPAYTEKRKLISLRDMDQDPGQETTEEGGRKARVTGG